MKFIDTDLPGVLVIEPDVHRDHRGFFLEVWNQKRYAEGGILDSIVQVNHSRSAHATLRGLHAQLDPAQGKLVRVLEGAIFDVAVDIRRGSPTFGRWTGVELTAESHRQIWVPVGFAHGFAVISDAAQVEYGCTASYNPAGEIGIAWNDPEIGITWPLQDPVLSSRDAAAPPLAEVEGLPVFAS
jgi:dTDP-4-dehydrorhamnose 3,5-epimerase